VLIPSQIQDRGLIHSGSLLSHRQSGMRPEVRRASVDPEEVSLSIPTVIIALGLLPDVPVIVGAALPV
jgi:hypothetical protein